MGLFENQVVVIGQFVDAKGPNGSPFWVSAPSDKTAYRLPDNRKTRVKVFLNSKELSQCSLETAVAGVDGNGPRPVHLVAVVIPARPDLVGVLLAGLQRAPP